MLISYADHRLGFFYDNKMNPFSPIGQHTTFNGKDHHVFMYNETEFMHAALMVGDNTHPTNMGKIEKSNKVNIGIAGGVGIPFTVPQGSR